jgi:hypothetical protein
MGTNEVGYLEGRAADRGLSRRRLLELAAAGVPALAGLGRFAHPPRAIADGGIVKPLPPEWFIPLGTNAEMRWDAVPGLGYVIPNERFFVRNHTARPIVDPATWRLSVFGSGLRRPDGVQFSLRELRRLPARTITAFIECAGDGRSFFASQQEPRRRARSATWARWASHAGAGSRYATSCGSRSRGAPSKSCRRASTRRSPIRATCAARCRSPRRSTTCSSPTR